MIHTRTHVLHYCVDSQPSCILILSISTENTWKQYFSAFLWKNYGIHFSPAHGITNLELICPILDTTDSWIDCVRTTANPAANTTAACRLYIIKQDCKLTSRQRWLMMVSKTWWIGDDVTRKRSRGDPESTGTAFSWRHHQSISQQ